MMNERKLRSVKSLGLVAATVVGMASASALARDGDHKRHRGYVDGSAFAALASEDGTLIEVSINGPLLKTVASALGEENEEIAGFLGGIVSISAVVIEDADDDDGDARAMAAKIADDLKEDGWDQVARVREGDESVTVLVLLDDKHEGSLAGITVMVSEGEGEIVFANIAGRIDLSLVGKFAHGFGLPGLDQLVGMDLEDAVKKSKGNGKRKKRDHE